jgi:hypothetical protein
MVRSGAPRAVPATLLAVLLAACGSEPAGPVAPAPVASVVVTPDSTSLPRAGSAQLTAAVRDAEGNALQGRTVTWTTSDAGVASVSTGGVVSASLTPGRVVVTASSEGRSGTAVVVVEAGALDMAIVGAHFTQGVQDAAESIPMVLQGNGAVLNVLVRATPAVSAPLQVVLRLYDAATGDPVRVDSTRTSGALGAEPDYVAPSAQFLVRPSDLRPGLTWQVALAPAGGLPDDSAANDAFPGSGPTPLATIDVPTLKLRFVPIVLTSHGNARGAVSTQNLEAYLRALLSALPIGRVEVEVGEPLASSATFGAPPDGGESAFWTQVLAELDAARVADPAASDAHWYGVVRPPPGFTYTDFGGWAYIPRTGTDAGPGTRTALSVQVGWFNTESQARDLVAHELGHNFGRRHSPCGGPSGLDPGYPVPGGLLDRPGHDVYAWTLGLATSARTVPVATGDLMGYCHPVWASTYTYEGVLAFRANTTVATPPATRVLMVRGTVGPAGVALEPAFTLEARPTPPDPDGRYELEGTAEDGRVLFRRSFEPAEIDHVRDRRTFGVTVPLSAEAERALSRVRVRGPAGVAATLRAAARSPSRGPTPAPTVVREGSGLTRVTCAAPGTRGILVRRAGGPVLAVAPAPSTLIAATPVSSLVVVCSDGVRTERFDVGAP